MYRESPSIAMLLPGYPNVCSTTVDHAAEWSQGDHFEGHFEGQNAVSECVSLSQSELA